MTEKLFYEDSHMVTFSATVVSCEQSGEVYEVELPFFLREGDNTQIPGDWTMQK